MNADNYYIEEFLAGRSQGFDALVKKYQNNILNIVYSLIGQDRESEDIAQEVFLKVYHNLKSFRKQSQFSTWLYRITVNTTYDFLRRRKNLVSDDAALEAGSIVRGIPQEALLTKERDIMVRKALKSVPIKYRTTLVLKDVEGLSYAEISKVLSCSIGTVESRIYRARQFLKAELLRFGGELI